MQAVLPFLFCGPFGYSCTTYLIMKGDPESGEILKNQLDLDVPSRTTAVNTVNDVKRVHTFRDIKQGVHAPVDMPRVNIKELLIKNGITKKVKILEEFNPNHSECGPSRFTRAATVMYVPPNLFNTDQDALRFLVIREIAHLKDNDLFFEHLLPAITSTAMGIFTVFGLRLSLPIAMLFTHQVAWLSYAILKHRHDNKAFAFAVKNSSESELLGARRFYTCLQNLSPSHDLALVAKKSAIEWALAQNTKGAGVWKMLQEGDAFPALEQVLQANLDGVKKIYERYKFLCLFFKVVLPHEKFSRTLGESPKYL